MLTRSIVHFEENNFYAMVQFVFRNMSVDFANHGNPGLHKWQMVRLLNGGIAVYVIKTYVRFKSKSLDQSMVQQSRLSV